ncbi:MAG: hypothetical protein RBT19_05695 [Tenuifilaceae bacterium]|jgi:hypothetical protein|nr:hypothetical protein [Tenuifilaceae bacterium]
MRTILSTLLLVLALQATAHAQCVISEKIDWNKEYEGTFLNDFMVKQSDSNVTRFSIILRKDIRYALHFVNPSTPISNIKLYVSDKEEYPVTLNTKVDSEKNHSVSRLKVNETGAYHLYIEFNEKCENDCVVMLIYLEEEEEE